MTRSQRAAITLIWALVQVIVFALLFFWCGVAGVYVSWDLLPYLFHIGPDPYGVLIGFAVGTVAGIWVCHRARMWLLRLRLRRLRRSGIEATATVTRLAKDYQANPRGPGVTRYTVHLRWRDPQDGGSREQDRRYRFSGHGSPRFESTCAERTKVVVRYDHRHPDRFVLDIPFAPPMAEVLR
ncbi:MAG TPA: DUF3592 domain-containing protein [Pseudonocardiaceae bacterium]|jgi:hypothetical protein